MIMTYLAEFPLDHAVGEILETHTYTKRTLILKFTAVMNGARRAKIGLDICDLNLKKLKSQTRWKNGL